VTLPYKTLSFSGRQFRIHGLAEDDIYFESLQDGMEPEFARFCETYIRPDYSCLDVGANIGLKSLLLAARASEGRVLAVEAGPKVGDVLQLNVSANRAANILVERAAVGDHDGVVRFSEDSAFGHISDAGAEVPVMTIESLSRKHHFQSIDFIKIDVEGFEFPILKNALDLINRNNTLLYFEFSLWAQIVNGHTNPKEFSKWILDNFSHVYLVNRDFHRNLLDRISRDDWLGILQHNCFTTTFVDDLVATNAPWRLEQVGQHPPAAAGSTAPEDRQFGDFSRRTSAAPKSPFTALRETVAQRDAAVAERDLALEQLAAIRNSTSWRLTAPLRYAKSRLLRL
jgi:FkbM family methyltransferase